MNLFIHKKGVLEDLREVPFKLEREIQRIFEQNLTQMTAIATELKTYSEDDHLQGKSDEVVELYNDFKSAILNLSSEVKVRARKLYISFGIDKKTVADIVVLRSSLKLFINKKTGDLDDPKKLMRDVSNVGHWGNGDYQVTVEDTKNLEYIMSLVKQAL